MNVEVGDGIISCRTYQYSNPNRRPMPPSPHYKRVIVCGAIEHSLPLDYIRKLKAVKDNGYVGPVALDLVAIKRLNFSSSELAN